MLPPAANANVQQLAMPQLMPQLVARLDALRSSGRARRHATDAVMAAIQAMSGQESAGKYNEPPATIVERVKRMLHHDDRATGADPD